MIRIKTYPLSMWTASGSARFARTKFFVSVSSGSFLPFDGQLFSFSPKECKRHRIEKRPLSRSNKRAYLASTCTAPCRL